MGLFGHKKDVIKRNWQLANGCFKAAEKEYVQAWGLREADVRSGYMVSERTARRANAMQHECRMKLAVELRKIADNIEAIR